ncbi:hypothetical protein GW17_00021259 [Ensete ventricosum]|nr:hypothetical protein GW17_00021254 [Ensete ventricosum]RWW14930.1 hypothetical protein GW17_00021259 [Ensete ventricosum]
MDSRSEYLGTTEAGLRMGMIGVAGELDCFSALIRLRELSKSEDKADLKGLSYPKATRQSEGRWTRRSAAEADLPIVKKGTQMQGNR